MSRLLLISIVIICLSSAQGIAKHTRASAVIIAELTECLEAGTLSVNEEIGQLDQEDTTALGTLHRKQSNYARALNLVRTLENQNSRSAWDSYSNSVSQLSFIQNSLNDGCIALYLELSQSIELERKEAIRLFEIDLTQFREGIGELLMKAKNPTELDTLFVRIESLRRTMNELGSTARSHQNSINDLLQILTGWQDFLNFRMMKDPKQAESSLRNLSRSLSNTPVVPRSFVLKLQNELRYRDQEVSRPTLPYTISSVVSSIDSIEDLDLALSKLENLGKYREIQNEVRNEIAYVKKLKQAVLFIDSGSPTLGLAQLARHHSGTNRNTTWKDKIRSLVYIRALKATLPPKYQPIDLELGLERTIEESIRLMKDQEDWISIWELLKIVKTLYRNHHSSELLAGIDNDIQSIQHYIAGQHFYSAGAMATAHSSFTSALRNLGRFGPYDEARAALAALRENHEEQLLEDQKRLAQTKRPIYPHRIDPKQYRFDIAKILEGPEFKEALARAIEEEIVIFRAKELKKQAEISN